MQLHPEEEGTALLINTTIPYKNPFCLIYILFYRPYAN